MLKPGGQWGQALSETHRRAPEAVVPAPRCHNPATGASPPLTEAGRPNAEARRSVGAGPQRSHRGASEVDCTTVPVPRSHEPDTGVSPPPTEAGRPSTEAKRSTRAGPQMTSRETPWTGRPAVAGHVTAGWRIPASQPAQESGRNLCRVLCAHTTAPSFLSARDACQVRSQCAPPVTQRD